MDKISRYRSPFVYDDDCIIFKGDDKTCCVCLGEDVEALELEIERLKKDNERISTLTIQWKQKACDRLNHEILPMRHEIERLKADNEDIKDAFNQLFRSVESARLSKRLMYTYQDHERLFDFHAKLNE